jgi:hypothetical protein
MDCDVKDHGIHPDYYASSPEEGLIWYDCVPREGHEPYHYWLQVSLIGMNGPQEMTDENTHATSFNETFTCGDDPDSV